MSDQKTGFGIDLDALEAKAKHQLQGPCTGMAHEVLELVAELRKARAERDWLAETLENHGLLLTVFNADIPRCSEAEWLRRAREAVEREIDHD